MKKSQLDRIVSELSLRPPTLAAVPHPLRKRPNQRRLGPSWWWLTRNCMMVLTLPSPGTR